MRYSFTPVVSPQLAETPQKAGGKSVWVWPILFRVAAAVVGVVVVLSALELIGRLAVIDPVLPPNEELTMFATLRMALQPPTSRVHR